MKDSQDQIIALLTLIARQQGVSNEVIKNVQKDVTQQAAAPDTISETVDRSVTRTRTVNIEDDADSAQYWSTGGKPYTLSSSDGWEKFGWGFPAELVNIRTTGDIVVAFAEPSRAQRQIQVKASESPFSVGGEVDLGVQKMYIKSKSASSDIQLMVF